MSTTFHGVKPIPSRLQCDQWDLIESELPSTLEDIGISETLFTIGNGFLAIRGYSEETSARKNASVPLPRAASKQKESSHSDHAPPCNYIRGAYVSGFLEQRLYSRPQAFSVGLCFRECFICKAPDPFCIDVFIAGEHVSAMTGRIISHTRHLDLRACTLVRRMVWESNSRNREVTIECSRFASAAQPNIAAVKYTVSARNVHNTDIRIVSRIQSPDPHEAALPYEVENIFTNSDIQTASNVVFVRTQRSCMHLAVSTVESCVLSTTADYKASNTYDASKAMNDYVTSPVAFPESPLTHQTDSFSLVSLTPKCMKIPNGTETLFTSCISEQNTIELVKYVGFFSNEDAPQEELCDLASQRVHQCHHEGFERLYSKHMEAMNRLWDTADITYRGSNLLQGALRFNTLRVLMNCTTNPRLSFPIRGLGQKSSGHHQWDADALIIPYLSHVCPERAKALLLFRINTLSKARTAAAEFDLTRGAIYPFRTVDGSRDPSGNGFAFLFVNSVIVHGLRCYVQTNNDFSVLNSSGVEMLLASATPLLDWGTWDKGSFHIRCVSGPDLYNGLSNDHFFTNVLARMHLQWAVQVATFYRERDPNGLNEILQRCSMTDQDLVDMERAASKIVILFDSEFRVHPADESFLTKKKWTFPDETHKENYVDLLRLYHPNVIYRHLICRIPDVVLAIVLLPDLFTDDEAKRDLMYYESVASPDSALRLAIFSIVSSRVGLSEKAEKYFNAAALVDLSNIVGGSDEGMHFSTAAGSLWALITGYGRMRVDHGFLHFDPVLPDKCECFAFHMRHKGCLIYVNATTRSVSYTLKQAPEGVSDVTIIHANVKRIRLCVGQTESVHVQPKVHALDFDCVVVDLDSIIEDIETAHFEAWKNTLEQYFHENGNKEFVMTREAYLAYLSHFAPYTGLTAIFNSCKRPLLPIGNKDDLDTAQTFSGLVNRKLQLFRRYFDEHGVKVKEGVIQLLRSLRECGTFLGCISYSKNGHWLLDEVPQLRAIFDDFMDGNEGGERHLRWRPETDYYEACARNLDTSISRTIIVTNGVHFYSRSYLERFFMVVDISSSREEVELKVPYLRLENWKDLSLEILERLGDANHAFIDNPRKSMPTEGSVSTFSSHEE